MTTLTCFTCNQPISTTNYDCPRCAVRCTCNSWSRWHGHTHEQRIRNAIHLSFCPISPDGYGLKQDAIIAGGY